MKSPQKQSHILERQLKIRQDLWPNVTNRMLWDRHTREGFALVPRPMPLMMSIMDDLSGKGFPVGQTYFEMWSRLRDELFLKLNDPTEMAFHAGFSGQRGIRTWKDRVKRLEKLEFIGLKPGPYGDASFAIFFNPYHVIKKAYLGKIHLNEKCKVREDKWQALIVRMREISARDMDDIDNEGNLIPLPSEEETL